MATTKTTTETLASLSGCGAYEFRWDARLVKRDGEHYLVCDQ